VKSLERMDVIEDILEENAAVNFKFNFQQKSGRNVVTLLDISKSYDDLTILSNTTGRIERGDKIALIGANGKGKSTLLRIIAGTEKHYGERQIGHNVNFGFYAQHQLEALNVNNELLEELKQAGTGKTEQELRSVLGCFLFRDDEVFKRIKVLSGGEKSRVALAKTLISESNFLLLDEPTNHLDMQSVNILIQALQQYEGTFVVVSHDRHFVSKVANKIWYIEDQEIKEYPGSYDEYTWWRQKQVDKKVVAEPVKKDKPKNTKSKPKHVDEEKRLKKEIAEVETQIADVEKTISDIEAFLHKPDAFKDEKKFYEMSEELSEKQKKLEEFTTKWEQLVEDLES
ncbi:MAG: ATP-binding cassette domain-containing protein, partial [Cyclobacteriaceae bacterium]